MENTEKILILEHEKCTGCGYCLLICSMTGEGIIDRSKSRIKVFRSDIEGLAIPTVCEHCENPPCVPACPNGCISKDPETGIVSIDSENCIGCGLCLKGCPFEAVTIDPEKNVAFICNLCEGDPKCVAACTLARAIEWVDETPSALWKRKKLAQKRLEALTHLREGWSKCMDGLEKSST